MCAERLLQLRPEMSRSSSWDREISAPLKALNYNGRTARVKRHPGWRRETERREKKKKGKKEKKIIIWGWTACAFSQELKMPDTPYAADQTQKTITELQSGSD